MMVSRSRLTITIQQPEEREQDQRKLRAIVTILDSSIASADHRIERRAALTSLINLTTRFLVPTGNLFI